MLKKSISKCLIALAAAIGMTSCMQAKDTYSHDISVLPQNAQQTLKKNFKSPVSVIKIDKDFGFVSDYEAILEDGTEVSFTRDGVWDNVEVRHGGAVPAAFIPAPIATFLKQRHPGQNVVGIDKERHGYDVELTNGIEIKFNKQGQFIGYDD